MEGIADSLCVGQRISGEDERVILFLKMAPGYTFTEDVVKKVKGQLRTRLSARHVPSVVLETKDIPVSVCVRDIVISSYLQEHCGFGWATYIYILAIQTALFTLAMFECPVRACQFIILLCFCVPIIGTSLPYALTCILYNTHTHTHTVHHQCQEGRGGGEEDHLWRGRPAERGTGQPQVTRLLLQHPRAAADRAEPSLTVLLFF